MPKPPPPLTSAEKYANLLEHARKSVGEGLRSSQLGPSVVEHAIHMRGEGLEQYIRDLDRIEKGLDTHGLEGDIVLPTEADLRNFIRRNPRWLSKDVEKLFPKPEPGKSNVSKVLEVMERLQNVEDPGREARHRGYAEEWKKTDRARLEQINKEDRARQRWKNIPKSTQNKIVKELSKGLFSGETNKTSISNTIKSNLGRVLRATGKKALPFGAALALWELAGRPAIDPTARSRERDRSSEAGGHTEERLRQLVSPAPW